jgi:hypothetical protein
MHGGDRETAPERSEKREAGRADTHLILGIPVPTIR